MEAQLLSANNKLCTSVLDSQLGFVRNIQSCKTSRGELGKAG